MTHNPSNRTAGSERIAPDTNITTAQREAFEALTNGDFRNFALFSCFVNGAPAAAIVAIHQEGDDYQITPLFVSITDAMQLTDHDGKAPAAPAPWWVRELPLCDGLEVHPVHDLYADEATAETCCEICEPAEAHFWSVYGHLQAGGLICLADFDTEAEAQAFAKELLETWPNLQTYGIG